MGAVGEGGQHEHAPLADDVVEHDARGTAVVKTVGRRLADREDLPSCGYLTSKWVPADREVSAGGTGCPRCSTPPPKGTLMTILVTGATGKLGRLVIDSLLARGAAPQTFVAGARDSQGCGSPSRASRVVASRLRRSDTVAAALAASTPSCSSRAPRSGARRPAPGGHRRRPRRRASRSSSTRAPRRPPQRPGPRPRAQGDRGADRRLRRPRRDPPQQLVHRELRRRRRRAPPTPACSPRASATAGRRASRARLRGGRGRRALSKTVTSAQVYELAGDVAWDYAELAAAISEVAGRPVASSRSPPRSTPPC